MAVLRSTLLFALAALAEIGGAWLIWQGVRDHRGLAFVGAGVLALGLYGFVATFQPDPHFGRILAAYGGVFVAASLAWGMAVDGFRPDRYDLVGAALCLVGVAVTMYAPRTGLEWLAGDESATVSEQNNATVRRLVDEVFNGGHLEVIDELYAPELAAAARRWISPFRASFPDVHMELVELIAEGDKVVGRFTCSATHQGAWLGQAPTGRRFERVKEVWILRFRDGRIVHVWSLEDTLDRLRQLGLA